MKKVIPFVLILAMLLAACSGVRDDMLESQSENPASRVPDPVSVSEADPTLTAELYLPNENADGFVTVEVLIAEDAAPQELVDLLILRGALPDGSEILDFEQSGSTLNVNMNCVYCDQVSSTGTVGEEMLLGSLVNTLLTFYEADELNLTCEGEILSTGHNDYDFPLSFYENYAAE